MPCEIFDVCFSAIKSRTKCVSICLAVSLLPYKAAGSVLAAKRCITSHAVASMDFSGFGSFNHVRKQTSKPWPNSILYIFLSPLYGGQVIGGAPLAESCMMQKTRAGVLPCDIWMFFSPELKNVHQFRYCCQSRKVCSSFRSMFFLTDGECDFGSPIDSLLLDDKFFTCISSACRIHALRHVSQISTSLYIYMYIYIYFWHLSLSLSIYIYMYTFMGTAVRSSDLWTRIIKHHAIMYVHCHHLNQVVGKHNTSEACEITGESVHGRNMGSPQYLCLHGFRIPWKVVDKRCTGMYSEGSISHAKGNKSIYLEHF